MFRIRTLWNQLRTRLILGALAFLLALSGAVILVVRDSLRFFAQNMEGVVAQRLVESNLTDILRITLLTIGYFVVLAIVGVVFAARALTEPIQKLVEGTRAVAAGDLSIRIPVKSNDELGGLASSFNKMAEELEVRNNEIMQANEALSEREAHLRLITEVTTDAIYDWDIVAGKTLWNDGYQALFGYASAGVHEHQWWRDRIHPDDRERIINDLELALKNREEFLSYEFRYQRADGTYAHVIDRGFIFYSEDGTPLREVGAMIDITDRVVLSEAQAQAALEERQRLARELHDSVTQSLYSLTLLAEASRRTAQHGDVTRVVENIARLGETAQQAFRNNVAHVPREGLGFLNRMAYLIFVCAQLPWRMASQAHTLKVASAVL